MQIKELIIQDVSKERIKILWRPQEQYGSPYTDLHQAHKHSHPVDECAWSNGGIVLIVEKKMS